MDLTTPSRSTFTVGFGISSQLRVMPQSQSLQEESLQWQAHSKGSAHTQEPQHSSYFTESELSPEFLRNCISCNRSVRKSSNQLLHFSQLQ